ncbi:S41 family peptidase [Flavobacterium sp. Fl-318]|uniref:S41 family peptidase n=1 Tax=Flavobacterium cupriresistens TaxID=2893885 RepID=A0ABU4RCG8_9FLAO|nr:MULTISPECIES: S41 family peptidase [unclassified Flavobacterium]MDX6190262.1 S41 family peptidase [Flavobacterium sp. Fl-318]UFH43080.1 peptidase S41 [Flavobacterium sp. F-323]
MTKKILLLFIISIQIGYSSEINKTEKLSSLCKVWGFLKYYHPNVAKGKYNWDDQLLLILPKVEKANTKEELSKVYLDWIENLGAVKVCKSCSAVSKKKRFDKNFDLSWTQDANLFTADLSKKLKYIEENRFQGTNYYVTTTSTKNIKIRNEVKYDHFEFPDPNYRLVGLFKYWNTVEYFFPYKYLTDQNWNDVLTEMIPKFQEAENAFEYNLAMLETSVKVDDSHSAFRTIQTVEYFGSNLIPYELSIVENKAIVTGFLNDSLAALNDLRIGDIIEKIDGKTPDEILETRNKYIPGSNKKAKEDNVYYTLTSGNTSSVNFEINRDGAVSTRTISRYKIDEIYKWEKKKTEKYKIIKNNIGYVNMDALKGNDVDVMMDKLAGTKGIIFDIRNYPNHILYLIARRLNPEERDFLKTTIPDLSYPGKFIWEDPKKGGRTNKDFYKGKIVLLVNQETGSRGEYVTMCLQAANNVTTVGSQTWGADGQMTPIEFIGGYAAGISGTGIYYPDGAETQRIGVKVDVKVEPSIKGIKEGRDEVLEKAIEIIENEKMISPK